eukprot:scaffold255482_cov35-Prasinocladus_malaysianus.AAC.1
MLRIIQCFHLRRIPLQLIQTKAQTIHDMINATSKKHRCKGRALPTLLMAMCSGAGNSRAVKAQRVQQKDLGEIPTVGCRCSNKESNSMHGRGKKRNGQQNRQVSTIRKRRK